ncbi:barstar family protein [Halomonas sp. MA07-2]|uniref:barstar family protein n=1 Tax=unclassified Halomonas TaxID=2609666 RepID=UPI003EF07837
MTSPSSSQALARFLADPAHGGLYRLAASMARGLGDAEGLGWHRLPVPPRWNREALLDALAESLTFPAYFGRNWDAAWDCLTELGWQAGRVRVILVPAAPVDGAAMATFLELMGDACDHWASRGQTLTVLLVEPEDGEAPEWLAAVPPLPEAALGKVG